VSCARGDDGGDLHSVAFLAHSYEILTTGADGLVKAWQ
jgi:hypothetical protein